MPPTSRTLSVALLCLTAGTLPVVAQRSEQPASFEVVSIKPIQPYPPYPNFFIEINKLRGNHVTARMVIAQAYGVDRRQVVGGPAWIDSDRFNIDARAADVLPPKTGIGLPEPIATMVRGVLADRFQLRARRETREMVVLVLTHARPDRRTDGIRPARVDCRATQDRLARATDDDAKKAIFADCFERSGLEMNIRGRPIASLADRLTGLLDRLVIDDTGIAGNVDLHFEWPFFRDRQESNAAALVAMEEQLGLKLESRKAPVPVVVIERIQRPSAN
jgi:uncharacterized protein (TIGR03435 family)